MVDRISSWLPTGATVRSHTEHPVSALALTFTRHTTYNNRCHVHTSVEKTRAIWAKKHRPNARATTERTSNIVRTCPNEPPNFSGIVGSGPALTRPTVAHGSRMPIKCNHKTPCQKSAQLVCCREVSVYFHAYATRPLFLVPHLPNSVTISPFGAFGSSSMYTYSWLSRTTLISLFDRYMWKIANLLLSAKS